MNRVVVTVSDRHGDAAVEIEGDLAYQGPAGADGRHRASWQVDVATHGPGTSTPDSDTTIRPGGLSSATVSVTSDRWGMTPLYWWASPRLIIVADHVDGVLQTLAKHHHATLTIDPMAAATMLALGQPCGDLTVFAGVSQMPPDTKLQWRPGTLPTLVTGERGGIDVDGRSRDDLIDHFLEAFGAAIARRLPSQGPVVVPLSGGADSRHIVAELVRQGVYIDAVVTAATHRRDPELVAARSVAQRLGLCHEVIAHPLGDLADEQRTNQLTHWQTSELAWYLPLADNLKQRQATVYDGLGGDILSAGLYQNAARVAAVREGDWVGLARDLIGSDQRADWRDRFIPEVVAGILPPREMVIDQIADQWRRYANEPNPLAWGMLMSRTRRHIGMGPFGLLAGLEVHTPYLDDDVVEVLRAVPMRSAVDHRLHRDAIARRFPQLADIGYADDFTTRWRDVRAGVRRRRSALRLMRQSASAFSTPTRTRVVTLASATFKSFLHVRRALTIHHAAERIGMQQ